jgi:hypothetical protein
MRTFAALLVFAAACATTPAPAPAPQPITGGYQLTSVDGKAVPMASPTESGLTVQSATLELTDGKFVLQMQAIPQSGTPMSRTVQGSYATTDGALTFTPEMGEHPTLPVVVGDGTLSVRDPEGHTWLFRRR